MALITTSTSIGWYGTHGATECTSLSLPETFGTYNSSGQFVKGSSGFSESDLRDFTVWTMTPKGQAYYGNLQQEKDFRNAASFLLADLEKLECGQMYWFEYQGTKDINVPNFVPTAQGVDMGRAST